MPEVDGFHERLNAAEQTYNQAIGAEKALTDRYKAELSRLLESHGVSDYDALVELRDTTKEEMLAAERELDRAFKEAGI